MLIRVETGVVLACVGAEVETLCSQMRCDEMCEVALTRDRTPVPYCVCTIGFVKVRVLEGITCSSKFKFVRLYVVYSGISSLEKNPRDTALWRRFGGLPLGSTGLGGTTPQPDVRVRIPRKPTVCYYYNVNERVQNLRFAIFRMAQIPLGSSRLDSTRSTLSSQSSESRRACRASRAVLFQHGGRRTSYSARLYKFSLFMLLNTQILFVSSNKRN